MQPFEEIRVLDLTRVLARPFCAYQMALLGAEVIKIEPPGRGESVRWRHEADPSFGERSMSLGFMTQSANRRFVTLDLDQLEGRDIFLKLAAACDVVVQNLRTGSANKRGIGYEDVKAVNPKAIFCSITAYGKTGPKGAHAAYDSVVQAWVRPDEHHRHAGVRAAESRTASDRLFDRHCGGLRCLGRALPAQPHGRGAVHRSLHAGYHDRPHGLDGDGVSQYRRRTQACRQQCLEPRAGLDDFQHGGRAHRIRDQRGAPVPEHVERSRAREAQPGSALCRLAGAAPERADAAHGDPAGTNDEERAGMGAAAQSARRAGRAGAQYPGLPRR